MVRDYLEYRAGQEILETIRDEGLTPKKIGVFWGPAGGPKWFVSVGFDRAMMRSGFLQTGHRKVLLVGSSAGAWRCIAMTCANPLEAHEKLRIAYSRNVFTRQDTPQTISDALRSNVNAFIADKDIPFILQNERFDLAFHVVRAKGLAGSDNKRSEGLGLLAAGFLNIFTPRGMDGLFERCVFHNSDRPPRFAQEGFRGSAIPLTPENVRDAALATGSLPYIIAGVKDISGGPPGIYRDGGLIDYQLNQDYKSPDGTLTLFFHHQERIVPGWLDKPLTWRRPPTGALDRVLQVFPSEAFVELLPGGRIPDRTDFTTFVDDPQERIRRWDEASELSERLGEQFLEDTASGRIRRLVQPMTQ
jgi:hypothetical protein